jgi:hypothetical protein
MRCMWSGGTAIPFLPLALESSGWSSCPPYFTLGEEVSGTHWIEGWVGPSEGMDADGYRKICYLYWQSNPRYPDYRQAHPFDIHWCQGPVSYYRGVQKNALSLIVNIFGTK